MRSMDEQKQSATFGRMTSLGLYGALIGLAVGGFLVVRYLGSDLVAPAPGPGAAVFGDVGTKKHVDVLMHVLLALGRDHHRARAGRAVRAAAAAAGDRRGARRHPARARRCSGASRPRRRPSCCRRRWRRSCGILAQVGVILYMFLVGLELEPGAAAHAHARHRRHLARQHRRAVPARRGAGAAALSARCRRATCRSRCFALFMGVAMSVTAFPVLARILTDRGMQQTRLGVIALTCAAVDDVTAWCLLAFVVSVVQARVGGALLTVGAERSRYIAVMFAGRAAAAAAAASLARAHAALTQGVMAVDLRRRCCCRRWRPRRSASTRCSARSCSARSSRTISGWRAS